MSARNYWANEGTSYIDPVKREMKKIIFHKKKGSGSEKGLGVRLAILQFLFGVIHKKVGPLQMRNADCGFGNAEFKILKTAWSIAQRALRESFFFFLPKIFLLS
jgi:hypothetical protein